MYAVMFSRVFLLVIGIRGEDNTAGAATGRSGTVCRSRGDASKIGCT